MVWLRPLSLVYCPGNDDLLDRNARSVQWKTDFWQASKTKIKTKIESQKPPARDSPDIELGERLVLPESPGIEEILDANTDANTANVQKLSQPTLEKSVREEKVKIEAKIRKLAAST